MKTKERNLHYLALESIYKFNEVKSQKFSVFKVQTPQVKLDNEIQMETYFQDA